LGAGVRTNPLWHSQDIPLVVVPHFSYYGKHFFIENLDPGVTLFESGHNTFNLVASPGYDRVFFYRSDLQNIFVSPYSGASFAPTPSAWQNAYYVKQGVPAPSRRVTYLAGPEWTFKYGNLTGQFDYLHEITFHNHGDEIRGALSLPLGNLGGAWTVNLGFTWK